MVEILIVKNAYYGVNKDTYIVINSNDFKTALEILDEEEDVKKAIEEIVSELDATTSRITTVKGG